MSGQQRFYRRRISTTQTLAKVFRAMEMIAASRIGAARRRAASAEPFRRTIGQALNAVAAHTHLDHPLTTPRHDVNRVAVLIVVSDRGMAGAYSATILREAEKLIASLKAEGKEPVLFTSGRRALSYFRFRGVPIERSWQGESDSPSLKMTQEIADELLSHFTDQSDKGVCAVYLVFTRFKSMMKQVPALREMLPITVVDTSDKNKARSDTQSSAGIDEQISLEPVANPEYEFIPSPEAVMRAVLPLYVKSRIRSVLLESAASELAARQTAMHTATSNANDLIEQYERLANTARQAEITQEISEIVGGADTLVNG